MAQPSGNVGRHMAGDGDDFAAALAKCSPFSTAPLPRLLHPLGVPMPPAEGLRRACSQPSPDEAAEPSRRRKRRQKTPEGDHQGLSLAIGLLSSRLESFGRRLEADSASAAARDRGLAGALRALARGLQRLGDDGLGGAAGGVAEEESPTAAAAARLLDTLSQVEPSRPPVPGAKAAGALARRDDQLLQVLERLDAHFEGLQATQRRSADGQERLIEQKACKMEVLREMVDAVRALHSPARGSALPGCGTLRMPRYRPYVGSDGQVYKFPEVAVATKLYQVCNVDTANLTYEVDFVVRLDWRDDNLEGILSEEFQSLDWTQYFNPHLEIDNDKENCGWIEGLDTIPRRRRPSSQPTTDRNASDATASASLPCFSEPTGPWVRKTMRFRGKLAIAGVDLRCFPFDIQVLPIRLKAGRSRGLALATPAAALVRREACSLVRLTDHCMMQEDPVYLRAHPSLRGHGHYASPAAGGSLLEYRICGVGSCHPDPDRGDCYEVRVLVQRPLFASHFWDLVIMNLLVLLAATSFWDSASPELSSRMSISLTVILTLAAYTSTRPAAIEKAPYVTFHDWCEQLGMVIVTGISVHNVYAVVRCGGESEEAPSFMVEEFERSQDLCGVGWCMSRSIDCRGLLVMLAVWATLVLYSLVWLARTRCCSTAMLDEHQSYCSALFGGSASDTGQEGSSSHSWSSLPTLQWLSERFGSSRQSRCPSILRCPPWKHQDAGAPPAERSPAARAQPRRRAPSGQPPQLAQAPEASSDEEVVVSGGPTQAFEHSLRYSRPLPRSAPRPRPRDIETGASSPAFGRASGAGSQAAPHHQGDTGPLQCCDVSSPSSAGDRSPDQHRAAAARRNYQLFVDSPGAR